MSEGQSTDDLERELVERKKSWRGGAVKKHGISVGAIIIAAFGAYEGYTNKEVAKIAATIAAEAKVDGIDDRALLVEEINKLKQENAELAARQVSQKEINKERYTQLRDWLKSVSRRGRSIPVAATIAIEEPPAPPAPQVKKLEKKRPKKPKDYLDQVQRVLEEKGF